MRITAGEPLHSTGDTKKITKILTSVDTFGKIGYEGETFSGS